mmetsp:Transcript_27555/g.62467  ORF Transcript_27555/g.62467 Transcript_27555/m.62467 type:complete len:410 (+) Transcript_27555:91-1320(+)|eukprot:CAMPEP_0204252536 /NCGR_PEP_ID=MMETSP0468-20130131/1242_1 /ASSEMBLY_ACC=CAM_ASM_000383 /TAXON_ID=2969 /ORGANISM="Oxyrrhis marina" /LENGTH=409 /DNA_ID=CAMNT_0051225975 /DNA_START=83 /DNA_END=1312 /DNA_ORIENTATION=+
MSKGTVCVCGAGNASQVFIALFASQGYKVTVLADFEDEAERLEAALEVSGGITVTNRSDPEHICTFKGGPVRVSKHAVDVVPQADSVVIALPSFAHKKILMDVRDHLRSGAVLFVMPGQGGVDFLGRQILGDRLLRGDVILAGVMPMPLNCRIQKFGDSVDLASIKHSYDLAAIPAEAAPQAAAMLSTMLGKEVRALEHFIAVHLWPANPNIHPGRLYALFHEHVAGKVYERNPLFYEEFDELSAEWCQKINDERMAVWTAAVQQSGGAVGNVEDVPHLKPYIESAYFGQIHDSSTLSSVFSTNDGFKGFRCPMKQVEEGWVPDFDNRYFTEDIPCTVAIYKGVAEIVGVDTPAIDEVMTFFQHFMGKEYVKQGSLCGHDVAETMAPQAFGITCLRDFGVSARGAGAGA